MRGRIDRDADVVTLTLAGEFDLVARDAFTVTVTQIEATRPRAIVVNLTELDFMDLSGIHGLLGAHRRAEGSHAFAVLDGSGPAHRTIRLVGLEGLLTQPARPRRGARLRDPA